MVKRKIDFACPVRDVFPVGNKYLGEVGLEVEVEGHNLPKAIPSYWRVEKDDSLRGESAEYVLVKPCTRINVPNYTKYLEKRLTAEGVKVDDSPRTSVHVHVNMSKYNLRQVYTYIVLYLILEGLLVEHAGPNRVGNLFCLRATDAEQFIDWLANAARKRQWNADPDRMRYSSVNVCALQKFNSVEFRALRGTIDHKVISEWVAILLAIKDASLKFDKPQEILAEFSRLGPEGFVKKMLPKHHGLFDKPGRDEKLREAMWLVQEVAYATDWEPPKKGLGRMFPVEDGAEF